MDYAISVSGVAAIYAMIALSCFVVIITGEISFGQQAFVGIGAYAAAVSTVMLDLSLMAGLVAGVLLSAVAATAFGAIALRTSGFRFTVFTLVFAEFVREALSQISWMTESHGRLVGPDGRLGFAGVDYFHEHGYGPERQAALLVGIALVCVAAVWWMWRSRAGIRVDATAEDQELTAASGVNVYATRLVVFSVSGAIAGAAGGLLAHYTTYVDPASFGLMLGVHATAYTLIGGLGSVLGPLLGTLVDVVLLEGLRVGGSYRMIAFGALIVVIMILRPRGLLASRYFKQTEN